MHCSQDEMLEERRRMVEALRLTPQLGMLSLPALQQMADASVVRHYSVNDGARRLDSIPFPSHPLANASGAVTGR
jgi:hypothetical protein